MGVNIDLSNREDIRKRSHVSHKRTVIGRPITTQHNPTQKRTLQRHVMKKYHPTFKRNIFMHSDIGKKRVHRDRRHIHHVTVDGSSLLRTRSKRDVSIQKLELVLQEVVQKVCSAESTNENTEDVI